jgi:hypothetical protein
MHQELLQINKLRSRHDVVQHGCNLGSLIIIPQLDKPEIR